MSVDEVTVGLDVGTTAVKAVAADQDGLVVARVRIPHEVGSPVPGACEHDVDLVWRSGVVGALGEVVDRLPVGTSVAGVVVAAMVPSLGAVDRATGRAVGPGLLYGDHRGAGRTGGEPSGGEGAGGPAAGGEYAGGVAPGGRRDPHLLGTADGPGDSGELLSFLRWLAAHCPDASGFWPAQAVANHALTGRGAIDSTTAVTAHPLFDFVGWDEGLAASCGVSVEALPEVVPGVEPIGRVADGLPAAGALVGGGTIDALGEQSVAGADDPGDVLVICGGTLITWGVVDEWAEVSGLWTIPHTAPGRVLIGGPSNAGGLFQDVVRAWTGGISDPDPRDELDPDDLPVWLPYIRGERTPLHRRDLRVSLHDAGLHHGPSALRRAAYEAAGFVVRHHIDLARDGGGLVPRRIVATGGGVRSLARMQALADATALPVDVVAVPEGAALGAAFTARCVAGLETSTTDASRWARTARRIAPDPTWSAACEARYQRFRKLTTQALERS